MLFRCNIFCLVGGGPTPKYPPSKAIIFDDHQGRAIGELSFRNNVSRSATSVGRAGLVSAQLRQQACAASRARSRVPLLPPS